MCGVRAAFPDRARRRRADCRAEARQIVGDILMDIYSFQIRVTGIIVREGKLLLVKQKISKTRNWSLPGGRVEAGETLDNAIIRELQEETGLAVRVNKLLYICDKPDSSPPILHITFLLDYLGGNIVLPTNEFDENPISDVQFIPISELTQYGFSQKFIDILQNSFPSAGHYMGLKVNIGL
jgi:ADP-ribose pyrophosphatase YjhB (NUDIX family)